MPVFAYLQGARMVEYSVLDGETVEIYLAYLKKAMAQEPEMMVAETVDEDGIRQRMKDPFFQKSISLLAMENKQVLGRIEYHFYGCMQGGHRMAYVNWVYVLKEHRHRGIAQGLFQEFEKQCHDNHIDQYFLLRAENAEADRFYKAFEGANLGSSPILRKDCKTSL